MDEVFFTFLVLLMIQGPINSAEICLRGAWGVFFRRTVGCTPTNVNFLALFVAPIPTSHFRRLPLPQTAAVARRNEQNYKMMSLN